MKWLGSMSERFLASSQVRRQDENAFAEMFCGHVHAVFLCPLFKSFEAYMLDYVTLFHITCLMHQAWVFHLFKLMDIDSLPTLSSEKQQLGSGVRGTVTRKVESWFEYVHVHISASCTLLHHSSC